jgi:hypothetical protein
MTLPWLFNQWACNPFAGDPDRDAAADMGQMGKPPPPSLADVLPPQDETFVGPDLWITVPSRAEQFVQMTNDWPDVPNVIPEADHIYGRHLHDVLEFVNRNAKTEAEKRSKLHCFDYAHYQLHNAGYWPSGPAHKDVDTLLVLIEYPEAGGVRSEVLVGNMVAAIRYIKISIQVGRPVMIGIRLNDFAERPNKRDDSAFIEATNHFVVAVGMGQEDDAYFIRVMDYLHAPRDSDRMFLTPDLRLQSPDGNQEMTEMRRSN